jgi:hypothetical protein
MHGRERVVLAGVEGAPAVVLTLEDEHA